MAGNSPRKKGISSIQNISCDVVYNTNIPKWYTGETKNLYIKIHDNGNIMQKRYMLKWKTIGYKSSWSDVCFSVWSLYLNVCVCVMFFFVQAKGKVHYEVRKLSIMNNFWCVYEEKSFKLIVRVRDKRERVCMNRLKCLKCADKT